jgi:hypothetical protein
VRPIGFLQQGIAALWMQSTPWLSHLIGALNHAMVALVFVWVLRRARVTGATAALAGVFFVLSPLTTMATGWVAASFDQLYILFLLLAAAAIVRLPVEGISAARCAGIALATTAALLSKETAIVAPAAVLLIAYIARAAHPEQFRWRPYAVAMTLVLIPVVAYLLFRAPSIANTLGGHATEAYTPALANVPANALRFFAYPFRLHLVEMSDGTFRSPWQPAAASLIQLLLVGAVYWLFGIAFALSYLAGYFLPLAPILALPNPGAHYLYGSGLAMSLAMAAVLVRLASTKRARIAWLVVAGAAGLYLHNLAIQALLYEHGICQSRFLASVDTLLTSTASSGAHSIRVIPDPGVLSRAAIRAVANRERYTVDGVPNITFQLAAGDAAAKQSPNAIRVRMTTACTLIPEIAGARQ